MPDRTYFFTTLTLFFLQGPVAAVEDGQHRRHTAQHLSNRADVYSLQCLPSDGWTRCSNPVFKIICARRILAKLITQTSGLDNCTQMTSPTDDELICPITHKTSVDGVDAYGDHSLTVDVSNARTKLWHDRIRDCWLMLIRMSGWTASRETTHLLPGSSKRPDIRAHIAGRCVLFDVRTCTMTSGMGPAGLPHCAATPGHAAACVATAQHKAWDAPCQERGDDFVALPIETGGRQSEEAEQFLGRLVKCELPVY